MMKTKCICISGYAQHGKDTTAEMMKHVLSTREKNAKNVKIIHYADLLKYICKSMFDWDGVKDEYGRSLLQYVGTDKVRKRDESFWVRFVSDLVTIFDGEWDYVIIPDTRFPNEVNYLRDAGFDVMHIRVIRPNFDNGLTPSQKRHPSETAMENESPDVTIINSGTPTDLLCKVKMLCEKLEFFR